MDLLKIGQKLSIFFTKDDRMVEITCTISEILDDRLVLDLPSYFIRYIDYLEVGKKLTVKIFSKIGTIDFNTIVISSPLEEEFSVELDYNAMKLTQADEMPVINAVETLHIKFNETEITVKTFEIGTDYIKFYSDTKFEQENNLDCTLVLPKNYGTIYFKAVVSAIDEIYNNEFTISDFCMTEDDRQKLLYYMYLYSNSTDWEEL